MTLFEAPQYDPQKERRKKLMIAGIVVVVLAVASVAYDYRNWPEEHVVDRFFTALEQKDFETAYGIWIADKDWKQHPQRHSQYTFGEFYQDWGPGGEWGLIRSHQIDGSVNPKGGSGVVVVVTPNERKVQARIWVEKKDKSLTFSPY